MKKTFTQVKKWFESKGIWLRVCARIQECCHDDARTVFNRAGGDMLNAGISWAQTVEGGEYWRRLHEEFAKWYSSPMTEQDENIKPLFKKGQKVKILNKLTSEIVDINEEMLDFVNKTVTISYIDFYGYNAYGDNDGMLYYIEEDYGINVWTSELFKKK